MINPIGMFINTATVINPARTVAASGARILTDDGGDIYACNIQPLSASETLRMGRDFSTTMARGYFPAGTTIKPDAKVVHGTKTYKVIGGGHDVANRSGMVRVDLELEGDAQQ